MVIGLGGQAGEATVQLEGVAEEPLGDELGRCLEIYFSAWPDGRERFKWPETAHLVVRPRWVRYSDFSQTPALVEEHRFAK